MRLLRPLPRKRERERTEIAATSGESLHLYPLIPAKAGIQGRSPWPWVPAFAGTNEKNVTTSQLHY